MKKRIFLVVTGILILSLLLVPSVGFAADSQLASDNSVTKVEAEEAAMQCIANFGYLLPGWTGAKVSAPVTYYLPDDTKSAYEFTVLNDGKEVGFIIISARKDWMPVLEFGGGRAPSSYLVQANEVAFERGCTAKEQKFRLLYWGGLTYSVQFGQEMKAAGVAVHLPTGRIVRIPVGEVELQMAEDQARLAWDRFPTGGGGGTRGSDYISGVPAYYQSKYNAGHGDDHADGTSWPSCAGPNADPWYAWDGCSPIAGAMIHGYWDSHGYSNLPNGEDNLIDHNHHYMGTSDSGSTSTSNRDNGIRDIFDNAGYDDDFDVSNDYFVSWNDIKAQVGWDFPAVLGIHSDIYENGHSVTVVGYVEAAQNLVYFYNTWDTVGHYITFGDWDSANMTKVEEE